MSHWMNGSFRAQQGQVIHHADQPFCALLLPLKYTLLPFCLFGKSTLPLGELGGMMNSSVNSDNPKREAESVPQTMLAKCLWMFWVVAVESTTQQKEQFFQGLSIMRFPETQECRKQMAWGNTCSMKMLPEWEWRTKAEDREKKNVYMESLNAQEIAWWLRGLQSPASLLCD